MPSKVRRPILPDITESGKCESLTKSGGHCKRKLGAGTDHLGIGRCGTHGGKTPAVERKFAAVRARQELQVMGEPIPIHPIDAILLCVEIAHGEVKYCNIQIAKLKHNEAAGPVVTTRPLKYEKGAESRTERVEEHGPPALHIWITARYEAMNRLTYYSKIALAANIAERQQQLSEGQSRQLVGVIEGILKDSGGDRHPDIRQIVRKHLQLVSSIDSTAEAA